MILSAKILSIDHACDKAIELPLLKHRIHSEHQPSLEIFVDHVRQQRLELKLDISLMVQASVLTIRQGRIEEVLLGRYSGEASLECNGVVLIEAVTTDLDLG